ncbi:peptidoglycan-N-acetylmuramic acid deacetylase [Cytobacillus eiseniae]|uniref:Peptidoglycan-N-acetylmuramic acid deacetylase n=1 Tax=Cytobacillus eiseniae TaxID=762947 RepID=A0ABS4RLI3_9BACI|nr:delta-lactam-biosynthetic de-N-acetylase [Cytobacillus eiseniae]MBP2242672.1 peptidoglycan-N-acetylmuramic acid deacetylase [Cytobacillus eiseniae]
MIKRKYLIILTGLLLLCSTTVYAEFANSPIHWGFNKGANEEQAEAGKPLDAMLERMGAIYKGDASKKEIYLTFDNGYENGYTAKILDILKNKHVPAAFFITGHYINTAPDLVKRMAAEGHIIGNHSWHHPDMTRISRERFAEELEKVREGTEKLTGIKQMSYLRPPRGIFSERTIHLAKEQGYTHIFWSLAFKDWVTDEQKGWQYSYDNIMRQIHPGAILLLHTVSKDNADALEKVIIDLQARGYSFKSLDDLMMGHSIKESMLY